MAAFLLRRLLSGLLMILTLTFLTFFVFNEIPTNPACLIVACGPHTTTTDADIRAADHRLGIDRPVYVQYGSFVWHLVRHGTFGDGLDDADERADTDRTGAARDGVARRRWTDSDDAARSAAWLHRGAPAPLAGRPRLARGEHDRSRDPAVRARDHGPRLLPDPPPRSRASATAP